MLFTRFLSCARGLCAGLALACAGVAAADIARSGAFRAALEAHAAGRLDEAEAAFRALAERHPKSPAVLNNLAVLLAKRGRFDEAAAMLRRALATDPAIDASYRNLSAIYAHRAALSYRRALSLDAVDPDAPPLTLIGERAAADEEADPLARLLQDERLDRPLVREPASARAPTGSRAADAAAAPPEHEAVAVVRRWAKAWSDQDLDAYFASYVDDHRSDAASSRAWRRERRARITAPREIRVVLSDIRVRQEDERAAVVTFRQRYNSDLLSRTTRKRLDMVKTPQGWKIFAERIVR